MQLPPAATKASSNVNDVASSTVQPKTLPPNTSGAICRADLPSRRFSTAFLLQELAVIIRYGCRRMKPKKQQRVLAIDVGGSHVKVRVSNRRDVRQFESGPQMTASRMVAGVHKLVGDWKYDV